MCGVLFRANISVGVWLLKDKNLSISGVSTLVLVKSRKVTIQHSRLYMPSDTVFCKNEKFLCNYLQASVFSQSSVFSIPTLPSEHSVLWLFYNNLIIPLYISAYVSTMEFVRVQPFLSLCNSKLYLQGSMRSAEGRSGPAMHSSSSAGMHMSQLY